MELKIRAFSGTLESSDVYIIVEPNEMGIEVEIKSTVLDQFGDDIRRVIDETLSEMNITSAKITVEDKGALDVVIKSRLQTALMRSAESKEFNWN